MQPGTKYILYPFQTTLHDGQVRIYRPQMNDTVDARWVDGKIVGADDVPARILADIERRLMSPDVMISR